jgi:hypothetical protein
MQNHHPMSHFKMRKEESSLFTHLKDLDACGTFEPARSLTSVVYSSEGAKGLSASELGLSFYLKKRARVSKEVKVGGSVKVKFANGLPYATDPAFEVQHKFGSLHGSSIIVTPHSLVLAHLRRLTRAGNTWLSGLMNFSFTDEKLTPKQLSLCARFHPEGSEWLENTITTLCFDSPKIRQDGNFWIHGFLTATAITKINKNLVAGLQIKQSTGQGSGQTLQGNARPDLKPVIQVALRATKDLSTLTVSGMLDTQHISQRSELKVTGEYFVEQVGVSIVSSSTYTFNNKPLKWSVGAYIHIDDVIPL